MNLEHVAEGCMAIVGFEMGSGVNLDVVMMQNPSPIGPCNCTQQQAPENRWCFSRLPLLLRQLKSGGTWLNEDGEIYIPLFGAPLAAFYTL